MVCYGCEVWLLKTEEQRKLLALEMDYLKRSARVSRLQKIPNITIWSKMQAEQSILGRIQRRQLNWYWHLHRMEDSRWSKKIYLWTTHGRRRRGRRNNHGGTKWRTSWKAEIWEKILAFGSGWTVLDCIGCIIILCDKDLTETLHVVNICCNNQFRNMIMQVI